jgi:hypothetical protein
MPDIDSRVIDLTRQHGTAAHKEIVHQLHPAWLRLIEYCARLGHGEIEKLKIQDGLPMAAEITTRKIKFSS